MAGGNIDIYPADFIGITGGPQPPTIAPNPVAPGGVSPADAAAAGLGAAGNIGVPGDDAKGTEKSSDRQAHAADAAAKFPANEADSAAQLQGVGQQGGIAQMLPQLAGALAGAVGGVLGPITQAPQQVMQAGQGALQPLMSAMQGGKDGGGGGDPLGGMSDEELLSSLGSDPSLDGGSGDLGAGGGGGGDVGGGGAGGGGGVGDTTPTGYMGPPPVPMSSAPTTPAAAPSKPMSVTPGGPAAPAGSQMGGGMMPMMPPGMGAGGGEGGKGDKPVEKRVAAPGVPNGQPVKGRMTTPPSVPVTKSVEGKPAAGVTAQKRIVEKSEAQE